MSDGVVKIATVGLGGYAAVICDLLESASLQPDLRLRLAAVCEPDQTTHAARIHRLAAAGVATDIEFDSFIRGDFDIVWLPLPIHLHRRFTEMSLAAGKHVMCEKPAAGCVDDLDAMIAARDRARRQLLFGFQDIYEPSTGPIKRRLLDGAIGTIESATVIGCWPRSQAYFSRNAWAGRMRFGGEWVLDSPANNALAHFINLALFFLGDSEANAATVRTVAAELYRANSIENYDTAALSITTAAGASMLALLTHACREAVEPVITLRGQRGILEYHVFSHATITASGRVERFELQRDPRPAMVRALLGACRGDAPEVVGPVATAESARPQLVAINGASEAAAVHNVPSRFIKAFSTPGGQGNAIDGIEAIFQRCAERHVLPSELGDVPWANRGATKDVSDYGHFSGPA